MAASPPGRGSGLALVMRRNRDAHWQIRAKGARWQWRGELRGEDVIEGEYQECRIFSQEEENGYFD